MVVWILFNKRKLSCYWKGSLLLRIQLHVANIRDWLFRVEQVFLSYDLTVIVYNGRDGWNVEYTSMGPWSHVILLNLNLQLILPLRCDLVSCRHPLVFGTFCHLRICCLRRSLYLAKKVHLSYSLLLIDYDLHFKVCFAPIYVGCVVQPEGKKKLFSC